MRLDPNRLVLGSGKYLLKVDGTLWLEYLTQRTKVRVSLPAAALMDAVMCVCFPNLPNISGVFHKNGVNPKGGFSISFPDEKLLWFNNKTKDFRCRWGRTDDELLTIKLTHFSSETHVNVMSYYKTSLNFIQLTKIFSFLVPDFEKES